jgi:hypothetical protein
MGAGASTSPPPDAPPPAKGAKSAAKPAKGAAKGGAKTKKAAVASASASASALLAKAAESEAGAKALFDTLDGDHDGKISTGDVKTVMKSSSVQSADWTDELVDDTLALFGDSEEMLDLGAFSSALAELKARGGKFDAAEIKARAAARTAVLPIWAKHVKEGGVWDKGCTGKLIRELNSEAYWDDFGAKVTSWHAQLTGSEDKRALATLEQFVALYPSLPTEIEAIKRSWEAASEAAAEAAAAAKAAQFRPDKAEWEIDMKSTNEAIEKAFALGRTPLLVDCTTIPGDDKNASFSPLETFYVRLRRSRSPRPPGVPGCPASLQPPSPTPLAHAKAEWPLPLRLRSHTRATSSSR